MDSKKFIDAVKIVKEAIETDDDIRCGFICSIASALKENNKNPIPFQTEEYVATLILNRVTGL